MSVDCHSAAVEVSVAIATDALAARACADEGECATRHPDVILALDAGRFQRVAAADRRGSAHVHRYPAVAHEMQIVIADDARLARCRDVERSRAAEDELAFAEQNRFLVLGGGRVGIGRPVGQGIVAIQYDERALAFVGCRGRALHVDGRAIGVGDAHTVQRKALFLRAIQFEKTVGRAARKFIHHVFLAGVNDSHVVAADGDSEIGIRARDGGFAAGTKGHLHRLRKLRVRNVVVGIIRRYRVDADDVVL